MKGTTNRYHLILSSNDSANSQIGDFLIKNSNSEKLLDIKINCNLTFDDHNRDM